MSARACAFECARAFAQTRVATFSLTMGVGGGPLASSTSGGVEVGWGRGRGEVGRGDSRRHLIGCGGLMMDASEARAHAAVRTCRLCPTY